MAPQERVLWFREAQRARDRQLSDMATAATAPYMTDEARGAFYEQLGSRLSVYSSEKADRQREHDAQCARNLAELFGRI